MRYHEHSIDCFARTADGQPLAYTPCRADGLDRNLVNLKTVDFYPECKGLTLICPMLPLVKVGR
jgi:hypothetical protein